MTMTKTGFPFVVRKKIQGNSKTLQWLSRTADINFQGLNVNISSHHQYHYILSNMPLTVELDAIKLKPH